jgi:hypothetical protein
MFLLRKNGATSNVFRAILRNSSTGAGLTGLSSSSTGLIISTIADTETSATAYTQAGSTIQTITTLGTYAAPSANNCRFKEVDSTNHPGLYEFQFADARFAVSSAKYLHVCVSGAASLLTKDITIQLTSADVDDGVRMGQTALPNAAANASGGIITNGTGSGQLNPDGSGNIGMAMGQSVPTSPTAGTMGEAFLVLDLIAGRHNTAQAGASNTITLDSGASSDTNAYVGDVIKIVSGTGSGQHRTIIAYNTSTKVATVHRNWDTNPDNTSVFQTLLQAKTDSFLWLSTSVTAATAGVPDVNTKNYNNQTTQTDTNNLPKVSLVDVLNTALTETSAGYLAAAIKKFFNVASPTSTMNEITLVDTITTYTGNTPQTGDSYSIVNNATYGNAKLTRATVPGTTLDTSSVAQTGDSYARIGANGASLSAVPDTSGTTTLLSRLTSARSGYLDNLNVGGNVASHADILAIGTPAQASVLGSPAGASIAADIAAVKSDTGTLTSRITSTLFSGMTSLAQWLGLMAGKQSGNSMARTEIQATGAGSGTYNETNDSLQAIRDRGDSAWGASGVASAVWADSSTYASGTKGALLQAAGGAADPLANELGDYASGTAGGALQLIAGAQITVRSPISMTGAITLIQGADYAAADDRALVFTDSANAWQDNSTGEFYVYDASNNVLLSVAATISPSTGTGKSATVSLTAAQTASLALARRYSLWLTRTSGHEEEVATGNLLVRPA